jgi:ABC-type nitrate/sulfonate/bicarbonate transport system substrate-binding protein
VSDGTLPEPELKSIRYAVTVGEISSFAGLLASMAGFYEKHGIKVEVTVLNADGDVCQSLLSGSVQMAQLSAGCALNSQLTDTPAKILGIEKLKVYDGLFCGSNIKTAADIKGGKATIGVSTLGSVAHGSALLALEALKLSPSDVTFQPVGGQAVRLSALKAGSIACAPIGMDQRQALEPLGFNVLVDLSGSGLGYATSGPGAVASFLKQNPNTALVVTAAVLEAMNSMWTNPTETAKHWADYAQITPEAAMQIVNRVPDQLNRSLRWDDKVFPFAQQVMAYVTPSITTVDAAQAFDRSYLEKLEDIGFYRKIGSPLP